MAWKVKLLRIIERKECVIFFRYIKNAALLLSDAALWAYF